MKPTSWTRDATKEFRANREFLGMTKREEATMRQECRDASDRDPGGYGVVTIIHVRQAFKRKGME